MVDGLRPADGYAVEANGRTASDGRTTAAPRTRSSGVPDSGRSPAYLAPLNLRGHPIGHVVIHVTQEHFDDAVTVFRDPGRRTSAHYLVRSADGRIGQCVREKDIARHVGDPAYDSSSIGITHEGWVNSGGWFTEEMYTASAALTAAVCARHTIPVTRAHILGHHEVSTATHTDPGANWNWEHHLQLVRKMRTTG